MLSRAERGCLAQADISGYTGYLAGVELEHAQDVLADLIETVVGALRHPFDYYPQRSTIPGLGPVTFTFEFEPLETGTRCRVRMGKLRARTQREQWGAMRESFLALIGHWYDRLADLLAQEVEARASEPGATLPQPQPHSHAHRYEQP